MSSSLPSLDAQSENYQQAVKDFLAVFGSAPLFELPEAQLALSTLDGLIEVLEWNNQGQAADEIACIWLSSLRWYTRMGNLLTTSHPFSLSRDFDSVMMSHSVSAADAATMSGLAYSDMQLIDSNLQKEETGAGALLRALPVALLPVDEDQTVAVIAAKTAALTHGSTQAIGATATAAILARATLSYRGTSQTPLADALDYAQAWTEKLAENTSIPGDGANLTAALATGTSAQDVVQNPKTALTVLKQLAQSLRDFEENGTLLSTAETSTDKLVYGLWAATCALAGYSDKLSLSVEDALSEAIELLEKNWFKELGIS